METDKEPSTYMDAMHIILRYVRGAWPRADERIEMAKEIQALVDKAVVANVKRELFNIVDPGDGSVYSTTRIGLNAIERLKKLTKEEGAL